MNYKCNLGVSSPSDDAMLLKLLALGFVALVFLGLGLNGTLNAAFAGYDKLEQNPAVKQVQNNAFAIGSSVKTHLANAVKSELPTPGQ